MKKPSAAFSLDLNTSVMMESMEVGVLKTWHRSSLKGHTEYGENSPFCSRVIRGMEHKYYDVACCEIRPNALQDASQTRDCWLGDHAQWIRKYTF